MVCRFDIVTTGASPLTTSNSKDPVACPAFSYAPLTTLQSYSSTYFPILVSPSAVFSETLSVSLKSPEFIRLQGKCEPYVEHETLVILAVTSHCTRLRSVLCDIETVYMSCDVVTLFVEGVTLTVGAGQPGSHSRSCVCLLVSQS